MYATYLYFILLLIYTIYCYVKKYNILGKILLTLYTGVAFFSVISIEKGLMPSEVTVLPYLLLIFAYLIYFYPFLKKNSKFSISKMQYEVNKQFIVFSVFYVICGLITLYCYYPSIVQLMTSGDWANNRLLLYTGELTFPYSNYLEYLAIQFTDYFRLMAMVVGFTTLRTQKYRVIAYSTLVAAVGSMLCSAIYTSSRGSVVNTFMLVLAMFSFYQDDYEKNRRRFITIVAIMSIAAVSPYLKEVTLSRFTGGGAQDSLISYFGQAPVVFNYGVSGINKFMLGKFAFGRLFGYTGFTEASIGGTWDNGFYTFVGWIYIDWGPIGVIVIGIISSFIIGKFIQRPQYKISDVYLILFYYSMLLQGVFVIGRAYCYTLVFSILLYFLFRIFFEKYSFVRARLNIR